jgi:myo-inositol-1(or 4)-monophosphatase
MPSGSFIDMSSEKLSLSKNQELNTAQRAADLGREVLLHYFGKLTSVEEKHLAGLVTIADRESEAVIIESLRKEFPEDSFLGEETGLSARSSERLWILDPLDGTTNYVHGFPIFSISIALQIDSKLSVAVVDVPKLADRYWARAGHGAFKNGKCLQVSRRDSLIHSMLSTGFNPQVDYIDQQLHTFVQLTRKTRAIRRPGSAVYDLCMVAEGVFDGFWEQGLSPWDTAAGALLVLEAGGCVTNFDELEFSPTMNSIVATNTILHSDLCKAIRSSTLSTAPKF